MGVIVNLDVMLARRKMASNDLAERIGLSQNNLSRIKTGKIKAIRFSTLGALCRELDCKPGDLLDYIYDETDELDDFEPKNSTPCQLLSKSLRKRRTASLLSCQRNGRRFVVIVGKLFALWHELWSRAE